MVTFNWETYTPYSIGFNETFSRLEALAGFSREDLEVTTERNVLTVSAKKSPQDKELKYQHKGISYRTFARNWQMGDDVEVESVDFVNGLLSITLRKELPDKQKHKKHF